MMGIASADCEKKKKDLMTMRSGALVTIFAYNLANAYKCDNNLETALGFFFKLTIAR